MTDKRWTKLGDSIINYSLRLQPGERLMIAMYEVESYPLALAAYKACIKAGGYPQIQFMSEALKHQTLLYGTDEQIGHVPEIEEYGMKWADCYLALRGAFNMGECYDIPSEKIAAFQRAMGKISSLRWSETRWTLVRVPNERFAQQANMNLEDMMDMFFAACDLDWAAETEKYKSISDKIDGNHSLRLVTPNTELCFDYDGKWTFMDNRQNVPDGEMFITPIWNTVKGYIAYEFPATLGGKIIEGLRLEFKNGLVDSISANTNLDYVKDIIFSDEGSGRVGEFAFGTNPYINVCTTDILMDEKMFGTIHTALGRPYDNSYSSSIHWDIIKDTRNTSGVYIDGKLIFKDGYFTDNI